MPSGFQQDSNQLSPDFYRVVLTLSGGTGNYGGAAPANGAVNPYDWNGFATAPTTLANAQRLARGNMRWQAIIEELTKHADAQILDVEVTSADNTLADSVPTAISFTVKYDRDDFVLGAVQNIATTFTKTIIVEGVPTPSVVTINTTARAIEYLVGTAIARNAYTRTYRVYDPTDLSETQTSVTINTPDDTQADIFGDVSANLIDGTELNSTI
jgi:hypothetical protein